MPNPVDIHVGKKVKYYRVLRNYSQQQLGARLGISFQQLQKYETGANRIGASRLWAIAQALEVPVAALFADMPESEGNPRPLDAGRDPLDDPHNAALLRSYGAIRNDRVRKALLDLAGTVARTETVSGPDPSR